MKTWIPTKICRSSRLNYSPLRIWRVNGKVNGNDNDDDFHDNDNDDDNDDDDNDNDDDDNDNNDEDDDDNNDDDNDDAAAGDDNDDDDDDDNDDDDDGGFVDQSEPCNTLNLLEFTNNSLSNSLWFKLRTMVLPWNNFTGFSVSPQEYAKVHKAYADLSSQPLSIRWRPGLIWIKRKYGSV